MPDITMCATQDCPMAVDCYRSPKSGTRPTEYRQSWSAFTWFRNKSWYDHPDCDRFMQKRGRPERFPSAPITDETGDGGRRG